MFITAKQIRKAVSNQVANVTEFEFASILVRREFITDSMEGHLPVEEID